MITHLYEYVFEHTERMAIDSLNILQKERLMDMIAYAKQSVPFYATYMDHVKTLHDFFTLMPISKESMRSAFAKQSIVNQKFSDFKIPQYTSGSTGVPFHFFLDTHMLPPRVAVYRRMLRWAGKIPSDSVIRLIWREHPGLETEGTIFLCTGPDDLEQKKEALYAQLANKTVILQSLSSILIRLAHMLEQDNKQFSFRALINYGEPIYPEIRLYLERAFGAKIFNYYANQEVTAIAQECGYHEGLHVNNEWVLLEIVDDKGNSVLPGQVGSGDIIVTSLENHVMPFIKYRTGDRGYWLEKPCLCGRTLPRIVVEGREINSFSLPDGKTGYFFELAQPIASLVSRIHKYQVIRRSLKEFYVLLVPTASFLPEDKTYLQNIFSAYLGKSVNVTIEICDNIKEIPGQKHRAFVNETQV